MRVTGEYMYRMSWKSRKYNINLVKKVGGEHGFPQVCSIRHKKT